MLALHQSKIIYLWCLAIIKATPILALNSKMRNKISTDFQFLIVPVQIVISNLDMNVQFNKHIDDGS